MPAQPPPTVSVLIPTYRYARYLPQTIESVLRQSFTDFELIVSDDDSRDGSADIINGYAERDDRIRFKIQSPNLGMVANWNWCLKQARGQYIKYVFGDDYLTRSDAIARLVELMESGPGVNLAASARIVVDDSSNEIGEWNYIGSEGIYAGTEVILCCLKSNGNLVGEPSVVMFRKSDVEAGFNPTFRQVVDWELWLRLMQRGNLAFTDVPLCAFRRHPTQQTEINRQSMGVNDEHPRLIRQYSDYLIASQSLRQEMFERERWLRRLRQPTRSDTEMANVLREALGKNYYGCLLRHRLTRPYFNIRRFWQKYILGKEPDRRRLQHLFQPTRMSEIRRS